MVTRRTGTVSVATLSALLLTFICADLTDPQWAKEFGLDVWNIRAIQKEAQEHNEQAALVEAQRIRIIREAEASGRVAEQLMDGKITLVAAIDELEPTLRQRVGFECAWPSDPPPTFRHAVARYAITRVEVELIRNPDRQAAVVARLQGEYSQLN